MSAVHPLPARLASPRLDGGLRAVASAGALQGLGPDGIAFGGGLPDPSLPPVDDLARHLGDVLREEPGPASTYGPGLGVDGLRRDVAEFLTRRDGVAWNEDQICIIGGSSGVIWLATVALLDTGDVVLVEEITYPQTVRRSGRRDPRHALPG